MAVTGRWLAATWQSVHRLLVLAVLVVVPPASAQDCLESPTGRFSATLGEPLVARCIGPRREMSLHAGAGCDPTAVIVRTSLGVRDARLSDAGVFVVLAGARTRRRDWVIVRLFVPDPRGERWVSLTLDDLPGTDVLRGLVHVELAADAVVFTRRDAVVRIPFDVLDAMAAERVD